MLFFFFFTSRYLKWPAISRQNQTNLPFFFSRWTKFERSVTMLKQKLNICKTAFLHCIYLFPSLRPHPAMFTCRTSPEQKPGSVLAAAVARCFVDGRSQLCIVGACQDRALMDWQWKWKETKWKRSQFSPFLWRFTGATVKIKEGRVKWDNGGLLREGLESPNGGRGAD